MNRVILTTINLLIVFLAILLAYILADKSLLVFTHLLIASILTSYTIFHQTAIFDTKDSTEKVKNFKKAIDDMLKILKK